MKIAVFGAGAVGGHVAARLGAGAEAAGIDGLLTAVQEFARAAGVATPHLDTMTALIIEKARKAGLYPAA